jgi:hypothetical protein
MNLSWNELFSGKPIITKKDVFALSDKNGITKGDSPSSVSIHLGSIESGSKKLGSILKELIHSTISSLMIGSNFQTTGMCDQLIWKNVEQRNPSLEALCEHSLIDHAARMLDWEDLNRILFKYSELRICENHGLEETLHECLGLLCDDRILSIFSLV